MKYSLKFFFCLIIIYSLLSLAFAHGTSEDFDFDMDISCTNDAVGPDDHMECSIVITNTGNIPGYACIKIEQPFISNENKPLYIYEVTSSWKLIKERIFDDKISSFFVYQDPIKPGQSTAPLFDNLQMSSISMSLYARLDDINIEVKLYASDHNDFNECFL